ncbi:MAG: tRNA (guanosine(46)-N7)-methyltransferase TrmB [Planctomycetia bacterium]|nr:tRNA (guanosine(46)-N7)-methyltransferase TrmB [Planctomycetia bacterium]
MPRRSLPKIRGNFDLTRFFIAMEPDFHDCDATEDYPRTPYAELTNLSAEQLNERLFGRIAPLELEIGSGKGMFLVNAATARPDHNFLGIEIAYRYALLCGSKFAKRNLTNAVMFNADAAKLVRELIPDVALCDVHIYFPDPWWKKAHRKRRIVRPDVIKTIEQKLQKGGRLHFWTDVQEYYLSGVEIIKLSSNLAGPFSVVERASANDMDFHTHFERRTRLNELPVYRSYFVKR